MSSTATEASQPQAVWRESFFNAPDGTQLFHASLVPASPKAVAIIVHGYGDHALRYRHVMQALANAGYASHALDYRGHGRAGGKRAYTAAFSDYTTDLSTFIDRVTAESNGLPMFIVSHSHGGLVSGTLLLSDKRPSQIKGAVFSSPYFQLRIEPSAFQLLQAKVVGKVIPFLRIKSPLTSAMLTNDKTFQAEADKDTLMHRSVTPRWFTESNAAQEALFAAASKFPLPLLVMQGAEDGIAHPDGAKRFFDLAGAKDKKFVSYPGMLHEIFNEVERTKPISEMIAWLDAHVDGKA